MSTEPLAPLGLWHEVCRAWKVDCLIGDGSLFTLGDSIWTQEGLAGFHRRYIDQPDEGDSDFLTKLQKQFLGASDETIQLVAECWFVHYLGTMSTSVGTKLRNLSVVLEWMRSPVDIPEHLKAALDGGFARPGTGYNTGRYWQLAQLLSFAQKVKGSAQAERESLLADAWWTKAVLCEELVPSAGPQRNVLLHLLFPETFERAAADSNKRKIVRAFPEHVIEGEDDVDRQLAGIRAGLEEVHGRRIDFYEPEIKAVWSPPATAVEGKSSSKSSKRSSFDPTGRNAGEEEAAGKRVEATNTIFFGPPGTGKTYGAMRRAVELIDGASNAPGETLAVRFRELRERNRIAFVTFHQSYSYEEFVEGIRPVLRDEGQPAGGAGVIEYECREGVFRRLCQAASGDGAISASKPVGTLEAVTFWKMSLGDTRGGGDGDSIFDEAVQKRTLMLGYGRGLDFRGCDDRSAVATKLAEAGENLEDNDFNVSSIHHFKNRLGVGDYVVISDGNRRFRALGRVTGDYRFDPESAYRQTRAVEWLYLPDESLPCELIYEKKFSQQTIYRFKQHLIKRDAVAELLGTLGSCRWHSEKGPFGTLKRAPHQTP